jgi:hypothetical protein
MKDVQTLPEPVEGVSLVLCLGYQPRRLYRVERKGYEQAFVFADSDTMAQCDYEDHFGIYSTDKGYDPEETTEVTYKDLNFRNRLRSMCS